MKDKIFNWLFQKVIHSYGERIQYLDEEINKKDAEI